MFEQSTQLAKQFGQEEVVKNNAVPNEHNGASHLSLVNDFFMSNKGRRLFDFIDKSITKKLTLHLF